MFNGTVYGGKCVNAADAVLASDAFADAQQRIVSCSESEYFEDIPEYFTQLSESLDVTTSTSPSECHAGYSVDGAVDGYRSLVQHVHCCSQFVVSVSPVTASNEQSSGRKVMCGVFPPASFCRVGRHVHVLLDMSPTTLVRLIAQCATQDPSHRSQAGTFVVHSLNEIVHQSCVPFEIELHQVQAYHQQA